MADYLSSEDVANRLRSMRLSGNHRRFLVNRMGNTGSTWLAKLLNAHPDVYCDHEGIVSRIWPRQEYDEEDILQYIEFIAAYERHEAYKAVGDVGSVWLNHVVEAPRKDFTTAILVRHPVRVLNSRIRQVRAGYVEFTDLATDEMERYFGLCADNLDPIDRYFASDCAVFLGVAEQSTQVDVFIRIESFSDCDYATSVLKTLTGLTYPAALIQDLWFQRINSHNTNPDPKALFAGFTPWQQDFYMTYVDPIAAAVGYELVPDAPATEFILDRDYTKHIVNEVNTGRVTVGAGSVTVTTSGVLGDYAAFVILDPADLVGESVTIRVDLVVETGILGVVVQSARWGDQIAAHVVRAGDQHQSVDLVVNSAPRAHRLIFRNETEDGTPTVVRIHRIEMGRLRLPGWPEFQPR